jgi:3-deoxy-D-manno-octulosonic acid (KDO) 8-phosphate synthase
MVVARAVHANRNMSIVGAVAAIVQMTRLICRQTAVVTG